MDCRLAHVVEATDGGAVRAATLALVVAGRALCRERDGARARSLVRLEARDVVGVAVRVLVRAPSGSRHARCSARSDVRAGVTNTRRVTDPTQPPMTRVRSKCNSSAKCKKVSRLDVHTSSNHDGESHSLASIHAVTFVSRQSGSWGDPPGGRGRHTAVRLRASGCTRGYAQDEMGRRTMTAVLTLVALLFLARDAGASSPPAPYLANITQYTPTDFSSGSGLITAAQCRLVRADPSSMFGPRSKSCRRFRPSATFQRGRYAACSLAPREAIDHAARPRTCRVCLFSSPSPNHRTTRETTTDQPPASTLPSRSQRARCSANVCRTTGARGATRGA